MSKVLVLYYSTYGHIETMAEAVAEGARATGATVDRSYSVGYPSSTFQSVHGSQSQIVTVQCQPNCPARDDRLAP